MNEGLLVNFDVFHKRGIIPIWKDFSNGIKRKDRENSFQGFENTKKAHVKRTFRDLEGYFWSSAKRKSGSSVYDMWGK